VDTTMDAFPGLPDGLDLNAIIDIDPVEGRVRVDLRENPDCTPTGLNLTEATAKNNAVTAFLMAFNTDKHASGLRVPNNSGSHRRIEVLVRENSVVGIPRHPASCSVATRTVTDRVTGMIVAGLAKMAGSDLGAAEPCLGCPPHEGVVSGRDPRRDGAEYILQIFSGTSGGPATADADGWLAFNTIMGAGIPRIDSSEIVEQKYPLVVWQHVAVRTDSEGAGKFRGAPGSISAYGPLDSDAVSHYYLEGVVNRPQGVRGGGPALGPAAWKVTCGGTTTQITDTVARVALEAGEAIVSLGSGAGGYGSPFDREPEAVLEDVRDEYISVERAEHAYGIVISGDPRRFETLRVDEEATKRLRSHRIDDIDGGRVESELPIWWAA
ncbi:MAG TPA: hydantoinase B/oxoprolinase family protein, partial [Pseudolysinimonas sp.]|nr:hydantoinase B/oxoprolinase family protein [Pseudolysinimonas sp.]